ncbi:MAG TPA: hypothetical protein VFL51_18135 [Pseudolabrys sp.]|nr:hypothetical protein [Pseudolabrys sp.]
MRLSHLSVAAGCIAAAVTISSAASCADWNNPYFHRETNGSWTNVEYNDGTCHYYYSHNAYDQDTHVNRYGDCSAVSIGPNGTAMRIVTPAYAAPVYGAVPPY